MWLGKDFSLLTPKCFTLAVAAVSAELRAMLLNKPAKLYHFYAVLLILRMTANAVHVAQFSAKF